MTDTKPEEREAVDLDKLERLAPLAYDRFRRLFAAAKREPGGSIMSIPARDDDADLLLSEVARALPELLRRARQLATAEAERDEARRERDELHTLHPRDDWHDDDGTVLWWMLPIAEQPYVGSLLDCDGVDEDYTHWSRIPNIDDKAALARLKGPTT